MGKQKNKKLDTVLDDLLVRFVLNCPEEEGHSSERLFFHIEEAHWFYCDEYKDKTSELPQLSFVDFAKKLLRRDVMQDWVNQLGKTPKELIKQFNLYKYSIPSCGAILVNDKRQCLAVKGYFSKMWGFPKGKINKGESKVDCAIREVKEEIGYDIRQFIDSNQFIDIQKSNKTSVRLYVVFIPNTATFYPQTKKEISEIAWVPLSKICNVKKYDGLKFCVHEVNLMIMKQFPDSSPNEQTKTMYKHKTNNPPRKKLHQQQKKSDNQPLKSDNQSLKYENQSLKPENQSLESFSFDRMKIELA